MIMESVIREVSGEKYRIRMIPAYYAQEYMSKAPAEGEPPSEDDVVWLMQYVDAKQGDSWVALEDPDSIDKHVKDWIDLDKIVEMVYNINFGFLRGWRVWRVPSVDGFEGSDPKQLSPFIHAIITNGYATLQELKTTCSLKDAFEMQDSILTKAMNEYRYMRMKGSL